MNVRIKEDDLRIRLLPEEIDALLQGSTLTVRLGIAPPGEEGLLFTVECGGEHPAVGDLLEYAIDGREMAFRVAPEALEKIKESEEDTFAVEVPGFGKNTVRLAVQRDLKPRKGR